MEKERLEELREILEAKKKTLKGGAEKAALKKEEYRDLFETKSMFANGRQVSYGLYRDFSEISGNGHEYAECLIMISGRAVNLIEGKKVALEKWEILFINRFSSHEILPAGEDDFILRIAILPEYLERFQSLAGMDDIPTKFMISLLLDEEYKGEYLHFKAADSMQVRVLLDNMLDSLEKDAQDPSRFNHTVTALIMFYFLDNLPHAMMRQPSRYDNLIAMTTLWYIEDNYKTGTLTELCMILHLPMHALSRLIKKTLGYNFKELLQQKRLVKAVMLLCDTDLPINDIVQEVGYENNSYFHKVFRDKYGTTPRVYRGRYSKNRLIRLQA